MHRWAIRAGRGWISTHRATGDFSSGCEHASWALLGALVFGAEGRPVDFMTVLVPRTRLPHPGRVGCGRDARYGQQRDHRAKAFVPEYRTIRNYETAQLRVADRRSTPDRCTDCRSRRSSPRRSRRRSLVLSPDVTSRYLTMMRERVRLSLGGGRFAEDQAAQVAVARAASEIDAAILQMDRNVRDLWDLARAGEDLPMWMRLRARRDQVRATERVLEAIDLLFKTSGGNSLTRGNPIERAWRDAHAGSVHVANEPERALALFGRGAFGLPVEDNLV